MKLSDIEVDPERIEEGAWVDDIPEMGGLRLKVRGAGNSDWDKLQHKMAAAIPRKDKANGFQHKDIHRMVSASLESALLDWEGVNDKDGNPIPYSKEWAHKFCFEVKYKKMRAAIDYACTFVAETTEADKDDIVKN